MGRDVRSSGLLVCVNSFTFPSTLAAMSSTVAENDRELQSWLSAHAAEYDVLENGKIRCRLTGREFPKRFKELQVCMQTIIHNNIDHYNLCSSCLCVDVLIVWCAELLEWFCSSSPDSRCGE